MSAYLSDDSTYLDFGIYRETGFRNTLQVPGSLPVVHRIIPIAFIQCNTNRNAHINDRKNGQE